MAPCFWASALITVNTVVPMPERKLFWGFIPTRRSADCYADSGSHHGGGSGPRQPRSAHPTAVFLRSPPSEGAIPVPERTVFCCGRIEGRRAACETQPRRGRP